MSKLFILAATLLVLVTMSACGGETATPTKVGPTPTPISASKLYGDYKFAEGAAELIYTDKQVVISGTVGSVEGRDIKLIGGGQGASGLSYGFITQAVVCKTNGNPYHIRRGDYVTVIGKPQGIGFTDVEVKECRVLKRE